MCIFKIRIINLVKTYLLYDPYQRQCQLNSPEAEVVTETSQVKHELDLNLIGTRVVRNFVHVANNVYNKGPRGVLFRVVGVIGMNNVGSLVQNLGQF